MKGKKYLGKCFICNKLFPKSLMVRHLKECGQTEILFPDLSSEKGISKKLFHLLIEGERNPEYWLYVEVSEDATLEDFDNFLRKIWVECCGHLSSFFIKDTEYTVFTGEVDYSKRKKIKGMYAKIGSIFQPGLRLKYMYDFGTPTYLQIKVLSEAKGNYRRKKIKLLAQNEPPEILCEICGKKAVLVCPICIYEGKGWVCRGCAKMHKCEVSFLLPVVNSPRVGMCGYTGKY